MNISKYDFHDGCLIKMNHIDNKIELLLESSEISDDELNDNIILSKNNTIKGKLHVEEIKNIEINNKPFTGILTQNYDVGYIFSFHIEGEKLILIVGWENRPPKIYQRTDFVKIEIEASRIYWENIPNLQNPFRL